MHAETLATPTLAVGGTTTAEGPSNRSADQDVLSARTFRLLLAAVLLAGAGVRLAQYLSNRSFWEDESFIVLNLRHKTAGELLQGLAHTQVAPPLFLLGERAAVVTLGGSEFALRLLPLLAGLASLVALAAVAKRLLSPPAVLVVVGLFAVSDRMIWHGTEVKPYAIDALAALLIALAATPRARAALPESTAGATPGAQRSGAPDSGVPDGSQHAVDDPEPDAALNAQADDRSAFARLARTAAVATVLVWLSYPSVFIFAAWSLALLPAVVRVGQSRGAAGRRGFGVVGGLLRYGACNLPVVASFAAVLLLTVQRQESGKLSDYWGDAFADLSGPVAFVVWVARKLFTLCNYACEPLAPAVLVLAIVGGVALWRARRRQLLAGLALPLALAIVAAAAKRYPFDGERVSTYLVPSVLLLAGAGLQFAIGRLVRWAKNAPDTFETEPPPASPPRLARAWAVAAAALLAYPAAMCAYHLVHPRTRAHVRPAAAYVAARIQPGDWIYCDPNVHQFLCYWPQAKALATAGAPPLPEAPGEPLPAKRLADGHRPPGRFWLVLAYAPERNDEKKVAQRLRPARAVGNVIDEFRGHGGAAFLFEPAKGGGQ